jgi:hypothetical protein
LYFGAMGTHSPFFFSERIPRRSPSVDIPQLPFRGVHIVGIEMSVFPIRASAARYRQATSAIRSLGKEAGPPWATADFRSESLPLNSPEPKHAVHTPSLLSRTS